ncbi:helix-turn-helix domain-containing protein [Herminiimonas sp. CN]|uniref:helix-turn-helix domain-containing protein n=1 Tax=Herminiimonas sp. CN TaxID=1349818 RepID=UPI0005578F84|nr:helix-turn-helix domain-containing protein [Herminiimonas sp. CN]
MSGAPRKPKNKKVAPGKGKATSENKLPANDTPLIAASITPDILSNKSTATEVQLEKVLVLLRQGPKTTIDLRNHGIMMPASRIFQLKNECSHVITSESVTLYDINGFRHSKCARYHLIAEAGAEAQS